MKKKVLQEYVNRSEKTTLELFFGEGSRIEVKNVFNLSHLRTEQVEVFVHITDPEVTINYWPQNIEWIMENAWEFVHGKNSKCVVQASYDII
jgi:hypothetical protein